MRRRRQRNKKGRHDEPIEAPAAFANRPFRALELPPPPTTVRPKSPPPAALDPDPGDETLFATAMAGVRPLAAGQRAIVPPPRPVRPQRAVQDPDAEALAELSDLVTGGGTFDITDTTEFLEGSAAGVDHGLVRRLRRGSFAFRRHVDLHGLTVPEARAALGDFFRNALRDGERCVLVVHGRGLNSPDRVPVIKQNVVAWLSRGPWARSVLAFTSARSCDGGAGAMYVLLRRRSGAKKSVRVTEGAKW